MLNPGDRVLVAVSGGPDSVCLLSALHGLAKELGISLHVAHLDHMFRGEESAAEARFVAGLAERLAVPATVEQFNVPSFCRERGLSPQAGAREARYAFLQRTARETGSSRIATGHTADDQAETFLMRLIRGAGVTGLSAIPPVRENIIRPLIATTRDEVLEHLHQKGLEFKTDPSNRKPLYTRNRIRLEILPLLKGMNPRIVETLAAEAALLREEDEAVEAHLRTAADRIITRKGEALWVLREEFNALPKAFRRRLARTMAAMSGADPSALSHERIDEALLFMADAQTGRTMSLGRDLTISREYDRFLIGLRTDDRDFSRELALPGVTSVPDAGLEVETRIGGIGRPGAALSGEAAAGIYFWQAQFDYDKIAPFLTIRNRRPGDRFQPSGMGGRSRKLQDFFVDKKIPRRLRPAVPLLCAGDDILWVVGMRTDERFAARDDTKRTLVVRIGKTK